MKILTFTSLFPNSVEPEHGIFIYQRMSHVGMRPGHSVQVVAPVPYSPSWLPVRGKWKAFARVPSKEKIGNLEVFHPRYPLLPKVSMPLHALLMALGSFPTVRWLNNKSRFDVIDAHYVFPDGVAAQIIGRVLGVPAVVSARGTDMNLFPEFLLIRPQIQWALRRVAGGIGVCTTLRDRMVQFGLDPDTAAIIGNGVDTERFEPIEMQQARARVGIRPEAKVFLSVASLVPVKGLHLLIPAFAQVCKQDPEVLLYIVGKGPEHDNLKRLIDQLDLEQKVFLVGKKAYDELKYWYSAANVTCLVSSREGWPNVLLESMACGTPVLATGVSGIPEIIVNQHLGIIVDQNIESISAGLKCAMERNWNRAIIAEFARQRTWDKVAYEFDMFVSRLGIPPQIVN
jgi:teichuronic acid biosynthesis glycosyltransferase TuaC